MRIMFVFVAALSALPFFADAHGSGLSFEATQQGYFIDIGYDDIAGGELSSFDLGLFKADNLERVSYDYAWVHISRGGKVWFAGPVSSMDFGKPGFSMVFSAAGIYDVNVKFMDDGKLLTEASFPVEASGDVRDPSKSSVRAGFVVGVAIAAFALGWTVKRYV